MSAYSIIPALPCGLAPDRGGRRPIYSGPGTLGA